MSEVPECEVPECEVRYPIRHWKGKFWQYHRTIPLFHGDKIISETKNCVVISRRKIELENEIIPTYIDTFYFEVTPTYQHPITTTVEKPKDCLYFERDYIPMYEGDVVISWNPTETCIRRSPGRKREDGGGLARAMYIVYQHTPEVYKRPKLTRRFRLDIEKKVWVQILHTDTLTDIEWTGGQTR